MTDTTAPDAITQVDTRWIYQAVQPYMDDQIGRKPLVRAALRSGAALHAANLIADAHRRLAAHGAGEGLREALLEALSALERIRDLTPARANETTAEGHHGATAAIAGSAYDRLLPALDATPPTDAGSTTREVPASPTKVNATLSAMRSSGRTWRFSEWSDASLAAECRAQAGQQLDPEFSQFMVAVADRLRTLATTSSPDASPDSGEEVNCFGIPGTYRGWRIKQGIDDRFYADAPADAESWEELREEIDFWEERNA